MACVGCNCFCFEVFWCSLCREKQNELLTLLKNDMNLVSSIIKEEDISDFKWEEYNNSDFTWEEHNNSDFKRTREEHNNSDFKRTREEQLKRYREKKKKRNYTKRYRYKLLKLNADRRKRVKGRFV